MTEQALMDAKLKQLQAENTQLLGSMRSFRGLLAAQKQFIDELSNANVNLRSSVMLLEEDKVLLKRDLEMFNERCVDLQKKIDSLTLSDAA